MFKRNQGDHHMVARGDLVRLAGEELDKVRVPAGYGTPEPLLDFLAGRRVVVGDLIGAAKVLCAENEALRAENAAARAGLADAAPEPPKEEEEDDDA